MKTYARWVEGKLAQIIPPAVDGEGAEIPIDARFDPDIVAQLVEYDPLQRPAPPPPPTHPELVAIALDAARTQRQPILSVLDGLQASALATGQQARAMLIEAGKQALRDITSTDLSACTTYEDMRLAIKARYLQLAAAAPADVRIAFSEALK